MWVSFLGDISLNDYYIDLYKQGINPFETLEPLLKESNFVVGNLESMAKGDMGENEFKKPRLSTTIETLNFLKKINLTVACLAQNHVYDHLEHGFKRTTEFLLNNEIKYIGAGLTLEEASRVQILEQGEIKIGLLNYVTSDTNPELPSDANVYLNMLNVEICKDEIKNLKHQVDHVVLFLHWGGRVEGGLYPDWDQPQIAKNLIDVGADLIIGHHSHTIQPYEVYKGKYIFYSIGNFCFADHWFDEKFQPKYSRNLVTFVLTIIFNKYDYIIKTSFYRNKKETFEKINHYGAKIKIRNRVFKIIFKFKWFWFVYYFNKRYVLPIYLFFLNKDLPLKVKLVRFLRSIMKHLK